MIVIFAENLGASHSQRRPLFAFLIAQCVDVPRLWGPGNCKGAWARMTKSVHAYRGEVTPLSLDHTVAPASVPDDFCLQCCRPCFSSYELHS